MSHATWLKEREQLRERIINNQKTIDCIDYVISSTTKAMGSNVEEKKELELLSDSDSDDNDDSNNNDARRRRSAVSRRAVKGAHLRAVKGAHRTAAPRRAVPRRVGKAPRSRMNQPPEEPEAPEDGIPHPPPYEPISDNNQKKFKAALRRLKRDLVKNKKNFDDYKIETFNIWQKAIILFGGRNIRGRVDAAIISDDSANLLTVKDIQDLKDQYSTKWTNGRRKMFDKVGRLRLKGIKLRLDIRETFADELNDIWDLLYENNE